MFLRFIIAMLIVAPLYAETILYGSFHGSIDYVDDGANASGINVSSNTSEFGISGSEDLGYGLSAIYQVENAISFSSQDGDSFLATCDTYVGLSSSKFGTFQLGRVWTAIDDVLATFNLFPGQIGDLNTITGPSGLAPCQSDTMAYTSPEFDRFPTFRITYNMDETDNGSDVFSISSIYSIGDLTLGLGYEKSALVGRKGRGFDYPRGIRFGASYTFNNFLISGFYQTVDNYGGFDGVDGIAYALGFSYAFSRNTLKLAYYATDNDGNNTDAQSFVLGIDHKLSEQTMVYAAFAMMDNDAGVGTVGGPYDVTIGGDHGGIGTGLALPDETQSALSLGIVVNF